MGTLFVVATPIGNLKDITLRALEILRSADLIICEDTRQTKKLLSYYHLNKETLSYHQHSSLKKQRQILNLLKEGKNLALVCDAGTPGIADPGQKLIEYLLKKENKIKIVPIPGPSALIASASISGFCTDKFLFLGFLPKKGRKKIYKEIKESKYTLIFYEAGSRIVKTLEDLILLLGERRIVLLRELTKKFETIYRGKAKEVLQQLSQTSKKGEFTLVIEGKIKN